MIPTVIGWAIIGIVAGWLAGVITRTNRNIWGDLLLGLVGAFVAGLVTNGINSHNKIYSIIAATIAAVVLVLIKNMITGRRAL